MAAYRIRVNGKGYDVDVDPQRSLLSVLRDELNLTGAKYGCGQGQCGACAVLIDKVAVSSCTLPVSAVGTRSITTIEGLARGEALHPVQQAFLEKAAFQCGFCTPGMIIGAAALLDQEPDPSPERIKNALQGHICRCGTYPRIIQAVRLAAERRRA